MQPPLWTDEKTERLKVLFLSTEEGAFLSRGVIAVRMGMTRSAIVGKLHRMGLKRDKKASWIDNNGKLHRPGVDRVTTMRPRPAPVRVPPVPEDASSVSMGVVEDRTPWSCGLLELKPHSCHFPVGTVGEDSFFFCGVPTSGKTYCDRHHNLTHSKPPPRKRKNRLFTMQTWNTGIACNKY